MHQRQAIREAVKNALVAASTAAGSRVYETRVVPFHRVELPAIAVYATRDAVSPESKDTTARELTRTLQLEIVGAVRSSSNVDDALDDLALQIERAMHADETFGDVCGDCMLGETELAVDESGDKPIGFVRLIYDVTYRTWAPDAADVELDDLSTVDVRYDINDLPTANEANDQITDLEE